MLETDDSAQETPNDARIHGSPDATGEGPRVTRLFAEWRAGNEQALDALMPIVYEELHRIATRAMRGERVSHTLQATALVNEAFLQLFPPGEQRIEPRDRVHFRALAARAMRRILVDHARARSTLKRGGNRERLSLGELPIDERPADLVALDDAMSSLHDVDPLKCRVIELRYFGGLTLEEVASVLELSARRVWEESELAKAWLLRQVRDV
ncbi:MAG: sigma-70 family RNA polymerase sigma factor [Planctomycetes bacterium]|nr:sigma-70 family RNA polymerase sigma factor [Planctomycetota bacterium]